MFDSFGALEASVQEKLDGDTDFQATLTDMSDEDKEVAVTGKKKELLDEEIKNLASKGSKNEELANNYKTRAEKAERDLKKGGKSSENTKQEGDLSAMDTIAIMNAKVDTEDIEDVVDYAKFRGISVAEALKSQVLKTILADKEEKRTSANAANTNNARAGQKKVTDDTLVSNMKKGEVPEPGTPEAEQLFWARHKKK